MLRLMRTKTTLFVSKITSLLTSLVPKVAELRENVYSAGTNNSLLNETNIESIRIVNKIASVTVILNFIPGTILFLLTRHYMIFIPSMSEGLLFILVPVLNYYRKYDAAVLLMFFAHCGSALYFGCLFGPAVDMSPIVIFLVGSTVLLLRTPRQKFFCFISSIAVGVFLNLDYKFHFFKPILLSNYNTEIVKQMATYIVLGLDLLVLYYVLTALIKNREALEQRVETRTRQLAKATLFMEKYLLTQCHDLRLQASNVITAHENIASQIEGQSNSELISLPRHLFENSDQSAKELLMILNNTLDMPRIKEGKLGELMLTPIFIKDELKRRIDFHLGSAKANNLEIELIIDQAVPPRMITDKGRFMRILDNLLSNAIKYTHKDTVILVKVEVGQQKEILFRVKDAGPGISMEDQENIFKLFTTTQNDFIESRGIGLPSAKQLALSIGGDLSVVSYENAGACFTLYHPIIALSQEAKNGDVKNYKNSFKGSRCLIIEDNVMSSKLLEGPLKYFGLEVMTANNAEEAMSLLLTDNLPDLIIMDKGLPDMDGVPLLKTIKSSKKLKNIPVIIVSADANPEAKEALLKEGADRFLLKPVNQKILGPEISKILSCDLEDNQ